MYVLRVGAELLMLPAFRCKLDQDHASVLALQLQLATALYDNLSEFPFFVLVLLLLLSGLLLSLFILL